MKETQKIASIICLLFLVSFTSLIHCVADEVDTEPAFFIERVDHVEKGTTVMSLDVDYERNLVLASVIFQGLTIYDASNPNLTEISSIFLSNEHEIEYSKNIAYVACLGAGVRAINITDPTQPERIGIFAEGESVEGTFIEIKDELLFIGDWADGIEIVNISDPTNMVLISSIYPSFDPSPLYIYDNYIYTNVLTPVLGMPPIHEGLSIIDISNLTNLVEVNFLSNYTGMAPSANQGNYLFAGGREEGLIILDATNRTNPQIVSKTSDGEGSALQVAVDGNIAYLTDEEDGLEVYNISNKENPKLIAEYDFDALAIHLRVMNSIIYVATTDGLSVLELKINDLDIDHAESPINIWSVMIAIISISIIKKRNH